MFALLCATLWAVPAAAQFNTTFKFALDSLSPMLHFNHSAWTYDPATNYSRSVAVGSPLQVSSLSASFVSQGLRVFGEIQPLANGTTASGTIQIGGSAVALQDQDGVLAQWRAPGPEVVQVRLSCPASASCIVHNITVYVPVLTQAPSLEIWEEHAAYHHVPADRGTLANAPARWKLAKEDAAIRFINDGVALQSRASELVYSVPANTSLVRVLGPSLWSSDWITGTDARTPLCTAALDPSPPWSAPSPNPGDSRPTGPQAWQHVHPTRQVLNSTLFILPLDPAVQYTLTVSPASDGAVCGVSGVASYPFYIDDHSGAGSAMGLPDKTKTVAGVIGGVAGGLLLVAVCIFLARRRLRRRRSSKLDSESDDE